MSGAERPRLVIRPRKMRLLAWVAAVALLVVHVAVGVLLRISETGVYFRISDQVALVVLGLIFAGLALLFIRPRVRVLDAGLGVRNLFAETLVPWDHVLAISFPETSSWARVDVPDDEYVPMMALSAMDGQRALDSIRSLRAAVDEHAGSAPR
ncbi:Protein of unknown function DUF2581 [Segniliparus rotundus DSM 44985]|uniref:Low molecular weight protein antigen 6 PH domain-containing protein n=1 Tax=Segniliparus rotundus (strain ATCC BAA-972 / CDC 1076 / CIP 108378 / DSM 44985 / JCM 13578) TaxID=640132 RepID=D6ZCB3_SEGRD|nr:PH domain-containing protein [Segniliparus rotundus]ADG99082.1 Protein of unknown function DUF2581 [Segniliparus rotundus DSM 44985]